MDNKEIQWKKSKIDYSELSQLNHQKIVAASLADIYLNSEESVKAQSKSASFIFSQYTLDNVFVKDWHGKKSIDASEFNYGTVRRWCDTDRPYNGYLWKLKKSTKKQQRPSKWNKESIKEVALKCTYKQEFKTTYQQAHNMAKKLGIFDEVTSHFKRPKAKNQYSKK